MNIDLGCAIVTRAANARDGVRREPLSCLRLPPAFSLGWARHGSSKVWWIESDGPRQFLRALCKVRVPEGDRDGVSVGDPFVLSIDRISSERITWPEGSAGQEAQIETGFSSVGVHPVDAKTSAALERTRQAAASPTGLRGAQLRISKLLRRTIRQRRPILSTTPTFAEALDYARSYFARAELPQVDGVDPFELAAHVIRGSTPTELNIREEAITHFVPLDAASLEIANWRSSARNQSFDALESSRRRHQLIVGELKDALVTFGLQPRYNIHVDVALVTANVDVLFEVKTATAGNFLEQLRCAVAQLLEYRFRVQLGDDTRHVRLVAIIEAPNDSIHVPFARAFARSVGVDLVLWHDRRFYGLDRSLSGYVEVTA